jgi:pimeloyl-ACP methyl ester carboxylesterase
MWQRQLPALENEYEVITYDLMGHGESGKPDGPYDMEDFVEQLVELANAEGLEKFALAGFSLGGLIVQAFTLAHPERVSGLGILHAAYDRTTEQRAAINQRVEQSIEGGPSATVEFALERWFTAAFAEENPGVLQQVRDWVVANDPKVYPASYKVLAESDEPLIGVIKNIQCPTLVMTAEEDFGNSPEMAQTMSALIPNARCEILPGLRHMAMAENPDLFNEKFLSFLRAIASD